jgi:CzcA family heavy metal efflux pump
MLNRIIAFSLRQRFLVLIAGLIVLIYGVTIVRRLQVDVFPDLNRPTVTILAETHGMAPEEVETLVTIPVESLMNGATGVQRVRSSSAIGFLLVYVEFDWSMNIYTARQIVAEKLQMAKEQLPEDVVTVITPISSIMGEIMLIGLTGDRTVTPMELRTTADWVIRKRLLSVPGVAQVTVIGGERKQFQVITSPERLKQYDITLSELESAVRAANANTAGGVVESGSFEFLVRNVGRAYSAAALADSVITCRNGVPICVKNVAAVIEGAQLKRSAGSLNGVPAVIMTVQKQPNVNTISLTKTIDATVDEIARTLPKGFKVHSDIYKQARFIEASIDNVSEALLHGAIFIVIILVLFLMSIRTTLVCMLSIPLSVLLTGIIFRYFDLSINTMTLGGIAIAVGIIVDDSIIVVENIYRRRLENRSKPDPEPAVSVIYQAASEVLNSTVFGTLIIMLAFVPLFALSGMEGRMFVPMGIAYIVSLFASLIVALTVVPTLSSMYTSSRTTEADSPPVAFIKRIHASALRRVIRRPVPVMAVGMILIALGALLSMKLGREFLPPFNEGTLTIKAVAAPGTSLAESDHIGRKIEQLLLGVPEVRFTSRRTGRGELDEHAEGVNSSEIDISMWTPELLKKLRPEEGKRPSRLRSKEKIMEDIRSRLSRLPGVSYDVGQPLSHRLDHILSGLRTQVAIKIFGPELETLRMLAERSRKEIATVGGVVDLYVEQQVEVPQLKITLDRLACARYGLRMEDAAELLETAVSGLVVSQLIDGQRTFDIVVRFSEESRDRAEAIADMLIDTPVGAKIPLSQFADVRESTGPNTINRENCQRRIVVQCNTSGRDLNSVIGDIRSKIGALQSSPDWPSGYFVQYGGQFESQQQATRQILLLSLLVLIGISILLFIALKSIRSTLLVLADLPMAMVGGIVILWATGTSLSVSSLVGFITLLGIATRNGIMMISHYMHLVREEGETFNEAMVMRGTRERLRPVLMTALVAALGMVPLALGAGQTGKELLQPLALVILGGLINSTLLDQFVTPTLFLRFGKMENGGGVDPAGS